MKNYYAILEVPVGCGVADIRQAYRRLAQDNLDNDAVFADLKEAHEVLTTPARRADYDRAVWGETFADGDGQPLVPGASDGATLLPGALEAPANAGGAGRCPMGAEAQCPVLLGRTGPADTYCPECGFLLAGLGTAAGFEAAAAGADESPWLEEPGGRSHRLHAGLNMVGRESADVLLPDKTVSRQHARLEVDEDGVVTVEDLSSTNGTQVGGDVLVPHMARTLQAGDRVRFGSVVTELRLPAGVSGETGPAEESQSRADPVPAGPVPAGPSPAGPSPAGPSPAAPIPAPALGPARAQVTETREEGGRTFPLVPGVSTFGRRAENSFIIQGDPYVSGSHAQIIADGDLFRLTDVGSTNGTLLNGRRLAINEPETLSPEDVILIGGTALRFELLEVPEEAPAAGDADGGGAPADMPAEPPARHAQEYDVPGNAPTQDAPTQDVPAHDVPTPTER